MGPNKRFQIEVAGDISIIRLVDPTLHEIILITELHDELLEYIEHVQPPNVLIDFAMVTQCSSAVVNGLLQARQRLKNHGGHIKLCSMHAPVREAFRLLNLDGTVFEIHDALPEALRSFSQGE